MLINFLQQKLPRDHQSIFISYAGTAEVTQKKCKSCLTRYLTYLEPLSKSINILNMDETGSVSFSAGHIKVTSACTHALSKIIV